MKYIDYNEGEHHKIKKNCFRVVFLNVNSNPFLWASFDGEGQFQAIKELE